MTKALFALPFVAFGLIAAKPAPVLPSAPPMAIAAPDAVVADPANRWTLELSNGGRVVVQLRPDLAPQNVYRIQQLTSQQFYDGLAFHRVIPGFMAQGGDPLGTGEGGSKLPDVPAEFNNLPHLRGVTSMARSEKPDSANSQFFIMLTPTFKLDHKYSAFGRVIEGMATVDAIQTGEPPENPTRIVHATLGGPLPAAPVAAAPVAAVVAPVMSTPAAVTAAPAPTEPAKPAPAGPEATPAP